MTSNETILDPTLEEQVLLLWRRIILSYFDREYCTLEIRTVVMPGDVEPYAFEVSAEVVSSTNLLKRRKISKSISIRQIKDAIEGIHLLQTTLMEAAQELRKRQV